MSLSCTVSEILSLTLANINGTRDTEDITFGDNLSCLALLCINQPTKSEMPSFTDSKDNTSWLQTGHVTLTTPVRAQVVILRLITHDIFYLRTKFGDSRFSRFGDMIASDKIDTKFYFINEQLPAAYPSCIAVSSKSFFYFYHSKLYVQ